MDTTTIDQLADPAAEAKPDTADTLRAMAWMAREAKEQFEDSDEDGPGVDALASLFEIAADRLTKPEWRGDDLVAAVITLAYSLSTEAERADGIEGWRAAQLAAADEPAAEI